MLPKPMLARVQGRALRAARKECSMRALRRRVLVMGCSALIGFGHAAADDLVTSGAPGEGTHSVVPGDTLWDLSNRYYHSSYEWPRLWSYNPEITNPHWIYPGHVLRLREGAQGGYTTDQTESVATAGGVLRPKGLSRGKRLPEGTVQLGDQVYLDAEALDRAGSIVGSSEDHMMLFPSDEVYLDFEKNGVPAIGKELSVFVRYHRDEVRPKAGKVRTYDRDNGEIVRVLGVLKVVSYDDDKRMARAVITEAIDPIERGFEVTDVPRRIAQVPPKVNASSVKSEIVAATRPLGTLAQNQVVFIGAGSKQGVEVGNRFAVVRQGDAWRDGLSLRALITEALRELTPGDRVEMRAGY
jgi:hypothetical protein